MARKSDAVRAAQTAIAAERPIAIDGSWGPATDRAYMSSSDRTKMIAREASMQLGWSLDSLRPPVKAGVLTVVKHATDAGISGKSLVNLLAVVEAESGFVPKTEGYYYSNVARAKQIFSALRDMSDEQVKAIRSKGPNAWFEAVYGAHTSKGRELGNTEPGDGSKFPGAGLIQLTGRGNMAAFAKAYGVDVLSNPGLMRDPDVAAKSAVWYWKTFVMARGSDTNIVAATNVVNRGLPASERTQRYAMVDNYARFA
jgi:predicted chitinase